MKMKTNYYFFPVFLFLFVTRTDDNYDDNEENDDGEGGQDARWRRRLCCSRYFQLWRRTGDDPDDEIITLLEV